MSVNCENGKWREGHAPSFSLVLWKPIRKWLNVVVAPAIPLTAIRILIYRLIGYKIGKNVFIGMKCYLDDLAPERMVIEDGATISYGVYFTIHGKRQSHSRILVQRGAYIGMRACLVGGRKGIVIGEGAVIGAGAVVISDIPAGATAVGVPARVVCSSCMIDDAPAGSAEVSMRTAED